ncbi:MAG: MBL fold metallo-hydrolase [Myxococcales bacterium]|nr:MBL fold metallo-hydrolase [Myxococcales bacterium]
MRHPGWQYRKGLHDLGGGNWAWLQPDGSWGFSNAGLVADSEQTLLVDTLFDLPLTRTMLEAMRDAVPAAARVDTLVNTHANGDHCFGNELVEGAVIVSSRACAEEMGEVPPSLLAEMVRNADSFGPAGAFMRDAFGAFEFEGITLTRPTETFEGEQTRRVGDKEVRLFEVGPAHTRGDVIVHVPADGVVYTGDILFIEGHPIIWEGPIGNWIRACERICEMEPEVVVPGHGPLTDVSGVRAVRDYLATLEREARARFDAGMPVEEAARDIALDDYASWGDAERIVVNLNTLYREFDPSRPAAATTELFTLMAELRRERR